MTIGHNSVSAEELRQFVERLERLDAEKKELMQASKEVLAEAKGRGYDTKIIKEIIAIRKRDPETVAEENAVLQLYREVMGI